MNVGAQGIDAQREAERLKYVKKYGIDPRYHMSGDRRADACDDLQWGLAEGCASILDVGCGRGEMLDYARQIGFRQVNGTEVVPELTEPSWVLPLAVHDLAQLPDESFDMVTSFDVIEHLIPGDDELLVTEMSRIAGRRLALTANNHDSICRITGMQLHINKRPYDEWDELLREWLPDWTVERMQRTRYVSETWRATR